MQKNEKIQISISEELLEYCKKNFQNVSLFIRETIREKINSGSLIDPSKEFIEIRAKSTYIACRIIDFKNVFLPVILFFRF